MEETLSSSRPANIWLEWLIPFKDASYIVVCGDSGVSGGNAATGRSLQMVNGTYSTLKLQNKYYLYSYNCAGYAGTIAMGYIDLATFQPLT